VASPGWFLGFIDVTGVLDTFVPGPSAETRESGVVRAQRTSTNCMCFSISASGNRARYFSLPFDPKRTPPPPSSVAAQGRLSVWLKHREVTPRGAQPQGQNPTVCIPMCINFNRAFI